MGGIKPDPVNPYESTLTANTPKRTTHIGSNPNQF